MKLLVSHKPAFTRRSPKRYGLLDGIINPTASIALFAAILLTGCGSLPKAELRSLQANCPNVLQVRRARDIGGDTVNVRIKSSPTTSLELDAARTLKHLVASTNFATLPGPGRRLLEVTIHTGRFWINGRKSTYSIYNPKFQNWSDVLSLSDEELSTLALCRDSFRAENHHSTDYSDWIPLYLPPLDSKCSPWSGRCHDFRCK